MEKLDLEAEDRVRRLLSLQPQSRDDYSEIARVLLEEIEVFGTPYPLSVGLRSCDRGGDLVREHADPNTLRAKQRRVAELLAAGKTRAEAAKIVGVGERTVYVWLKSELFQAYVRSEQARLRGEPFTPRPLSRRAERAFRVVLREIDELEREGGLGTLGT